MFSPYYCNGVELAGKVVVDVGGFIGDTALYFASHGAKVVYMFEPSKEFSKIARSNLSKRENIVLHNYGLGRENKSKTPYNNGSVVSEVCAGG